MFTNKNLKKIGKFFGIGLASLGVMLGLQNVAHAEETGPIIVQGIVQDGYNLEMNVQVAKADTAELVATYKLNEENNWIHKDTVPVGKYEIRVYVEGLTSRSATVVKATMMEKDVVSNPRAEGLVDQTPRFVVIQGDEKYVSDFYGMVDFQRLDGSMLKGEITRDEMEVYYEEAIQMQGEENGLKVPDKVAEDLNLDEEKLQSDYVPESVDVQEERAKAADKIDAVEEDGKWPVIPITIIATIIGAAGGYAWVKWKAKKEG